MRFAALVLVPLAACSAPSGGQMTLFPYGITGQPWQGGADLQQRGAVEIVVKSRHPALLQDIAAGGGPDLAEAMDVAGVPAADREARIIQLRSDLALYEVNPGALVSALLVYGSAPV